MLRLATFKVDCTPPEGYPNGFGTSDEPTGFRDSLYLRGFILDHGGDRCLVASLDYCGLMNSAYDDLIGVLAASVDILPDRAVVACIHQHDAPLLDFEIEAYLGRETFPRAWWQELVGRCAETAADALDGLEDVGSVGHAETRLHGYASNRRIIGPDGKVRGMRYSRCADEGLRAEPVGVIDPMLRTVAFRDPSGEPIASMSFYATHPQVANGRGMYSADAQGEAMRLVGEAQGGGQHAYFSGPFGNVTAGKYSSPTDLEGNLLGFGKRLAEGIGLNLRGMRWHEPEGFEWTATSFPFPMEDLDREAMLGALADEGVPEGQKVIKATVLSSADYPANSEYPMHLLRIGPARVLFVPGEPFVEFQLYVQSLIPDAFIAVAANCSDNFLYIPTAEAFAQGGYEVESFRWCTREIEIRLQDTVRALVL